MVPLGVRVTKSRFAQWPNKGHMHLNGAERPSGKALLAGTSQLTKATLYKGCDGGSVTLPHQEFFPRDSSEEEHLVGMLPLSTRK